MPPIRKIASNLLWTPRGLVRNPLLEVGADGRVVAVGTCDDPDRSPFTEFHAGLLVPDFPADFEAVFERMRTQIQTPLIEQLEALPPVSGGVLVLISGLDYEALKLTLRSQIRKL